ncbi:MAG TPA: nucleotidyltransferase family protein [Desulfobacterales bacterium]|nr:nucleotidyltransferase family protein [Desulfobacterales bacterium]
MPKEKRTAGIILAAGQSTRIDKFKLLIKLEGKYILEWVVDAALESRLAHIILVLGYHFEKIQKALNKKIRHPRIEIVINPQYPIGLSRSLRSGLLAAKGSFPSVMFLLGDQPMLDAKTINMLLDRFWNSEREICVPVCRGKRGNPTVFSHKYYDQLLQIKGDIGARKVLEKYASHIIHVEIDHPLGFLDVDTEVDLKALQNKFK